MQKTCIQNNPCTVMYHKCTLYNAFKKYHQSLNRNSSVYKYISGVILALSVSVEVF